MTRRVALTLVAVVVLFTHLVAAQSPFGPALPGNSASRTQRTPPPPPPVGPIVPKPSPSAPPVGIAQLPSQGVVQTFSPAVGRDVSGRRGVMGNRDILASRDVSGGRDVFRARRFTYAPLYGNRFGYSSYGSIAGGYYGYPDSTYIPPEAERRLEPLGESGFLRLDVTPGAAQVHVDGFYVGTVDDFRAAGAARSLEAGPHRVEIRADGYDTATFDVRIDPNEFTTYRRELARTESQQARNIAPAVPKTFYVIPKCYAGDKRPSADKLPAGCRAANVRVIPPVVNRSR